MPIQVLMILSAFLVSPVTFVQILIAFVIAIPIYEMMYGDIEV